MSISLYDHQLQAIDKLKNGSILCGGVGTGKSLTALGYYYTKVCQGALPKDDHDTLGPMLNPLDLYIITTAKKRDSLEWDNECTHFLLQENKDISVVIDSWNNIMKYIDVKDAFFIFDEQRVVGKGVWVKSFLKIAKNNQWILLSATPGDTWSDYIPVFIANGFYKNRTEFERRHVVYSRFAKFPKVDHYVDIGHLVKLRKEVLVDMKYLRQTVPHKETIFCDYDKTLYQAVSKDRWDVFNNKPLENPAQYFVALRRVINSDISRQLALVELVEKHRKVIVFYNFDYELYILRDLGERMGITTKEWTGHRHEPIPNTRSWIYLVQYNSGNEGWNCITTDTIIFYSLNYSYRIMKQAAGRIDRMNTPYVDLYYYYLQSKAPLDLAISKTLKRKKNFNEREFISWG